RRWPTRTRPAWISSTAWERERAKPRRTNATSSRAARSRPSGRLVTGLSRLQQDVVEAPVDVLVDADVLDRRPSGELLQAIQNHVDLGSPGRFIRRPRDLRRLVAHGSTSAPRTSASSYPLDEPTTPRQPTAAPPRRRRSSASSASTGWGTLQTAARSARAPSSGSPSPVRTARRAPS